MGIEQFPVPLCPSFVLLSFCLNFLPLQKSLPDGINSPSPDMSVRRERESWLLGSWVMQGSELLMILPQIRMGWVTALPHPSGGQRSSWDSPILLTEAPDQGASSRRGPPAWVPASFCTGLQSPWACHKTSLHSWNDGCVAASCSWLWGFFFLHTCIRVTNYGNWKNAWMGLFPGGNSAIYHVPVLSGIGCKCFPCFQSASNCLGKWVRSLAIKELHAGFLGWCVNSLSN